MLPYYRDYDPENPWEVKAEAHTIDVNGRVRLLYIPLQGIGDMSVTIPGYTETTSSTPIASEFYIDYQASSNYKFAKGFVHFNPSRATHAVYVDYYGVSTAVWADDMNQIGGHLANDAVHVSIEDRSAWDAKQDAILHPANIGAVALSCVGTANGVAPLDASSMIPAAFIPYIDASIINSGIIDIERLPAAALERLVPVADQAARYALTIQTVQVGDTVKEADTGLMWFVVDIANLGNANGYQEYTAGTASAVPWTGVTGKPTTIAGFGITDIINATAANIGVAISGTTEKSTWNDADIFPVLDSMNGSALSKGTWSHIKSSLKSYFDTIYCAVLGNPPEDGYYFSSSAAGVRAWVPNYNEARILGTKLAGLSTTSYQDITANDPLVDAFGFAQAHLKQHDTFSFSLAIDPSNSLYSTHINEFPFKGRLKRGAVKCTVISNNAAIAPNSGAFISIYNGSLLLGNISFSAAAWNDSTWNFPVYPNDDVFAKLDSAHTLDTAQARANLTVRGVRTT